MVFLYFWQMLLPMMWQMFLPLQCIATILIVWCYCLVADGIATCCLIISFHGQMLLSCGRWNCHIYCCEADIIVQWQMEWPLQGVRLPPGRCCSWGGRWIGYTVVVKTSATSLAITSANQINKANNICLAITTAIDTTRHNICQKQKQKIVNII